MKKLFYISAVAMLALTAAGCQQTNSNEDFSMVDASDFISPHPVVSQMDKQALSEEEAADLKYMREEEKLARDVYLALYDKWGQKIFSNIAGSEQTHTDSVRYLLERYSLEDPVKDETVGVFINKDLQKLYTDLVERGSTSLADALFIGATIEDLDIYDLKEAIARTDNEDIKTVYENLMRGSRNHMRAFSRQLKRNGGSYEAQYLSQQEIDGILQGDNETGGMGAGMGKNQGNRGSGGGNVMGAGGGNR
ncbi:MAG: DUF2202 domain-containing protein [Patescibacteria group bacterium]